MSDKELTLVVDIGTLYTKIGLAGEAKPSKVLTFGSMWNDDLFAKESQTRMKGPYKFLWSPYKREIRRSSNLYMCDALRKFDEEFEYFRSKEGVKTVLFTENILYSGYGVNYYCRDELADYAFSRLGASKVCFASQGGLSLLASGRKTGVSVEIGDGFTQVVPVYEGCSITYAREAQKLGGEDIINILLRLNGVPQCETRYAEYYRIKEKDFYVALDYDEESKKASSHKGISCEPFELPEVFFQPSLQEFGYYGVHELCQRAIEKCDPQLRKELYGNIVISGGSTKFKGFAERMEKEMKLLASKTGNAADVRVTAVQDPENSAWLGGAALASDPAFDTMCITDEYLDEHGSFIFKPVFLL